MSRTRCRALNTVGRVTGDGEALRNSVMEDSSAERWSRSTSDAAAVDIEQEPRL